LHDALETGWTIMGGGRTLLFDPSATAAWTLDFSISHTYNGGNQPGLFFPILIPTQRLVTVRDLHRTCFNVALGREWFLLGSAFSDGSNWRVGADVGGRYGTSRIDYNDTLILANGTFRPNGYLRDSDVIGGLYLAAHTDLELPLGGCKFVTGVRIEWGHTWMNFFKVPYTSSDVEDLSFLFSAGIRF
jgi:hypothetical protein